MFTVLIKTASHYENKSVEKADIDSFQMMDETEPNYSEELVNIYLQDMALLFLVIHMLTSNHGPGIMLSTGVCYRGYVVPRVWPRNSEIQPLYIV